MHARERKGTDKMSRDGVAVFMRLLQGKFSKEERNSHNCLWCTAGAILAKGRITTH